MATRADVAAKAGVSPSTVSYVLSGKRSIGQATRARVLAAVKELNYHPNHAAAALAGGTNKIIGLLAPAGRSGISPSFVEYINGATRAARELGWHLMVYLDNDVNVKDLANLHRGGLLDGMILMEIEMNDPRIEYLQKVGVPHVAIGRTENNKHLRFIDRDFEKDGYQAVDYYNQLGHKNIGLIRVKKEGFQLIGADVRFAESINERAQIYGMRVVEYSCENTSSAGRAAFIHFQKNHPEVTGFITLGDYLTYSFLNAAREFNVEVPKKLSILALAVPNSSVEITYPPLTTLSINDDGFGYEAGKMLIHTIIGEEVPEKQQLQAGQLNVRGTTATVSA